MVLPDAQAALEIYVGIYVIYDARICMYVYTYVCMCVCIYIYITHHHHHTHTHTHTHTIYIYLYICQVSKMILADDKGKQHLAHRYKSTHTDAIFLLY